MAWDLAFIFLKSLELQLQGDLGPLESPGKGAILDLSNVQSTQLHQDFAEGSAGCSLFKMQLEKGMQHRQTHLAPSSWDVNSSEAAAAGSSKLAQTPD